MSKKSCPMTYKLLHKTGQDFLVIQHHTVPEQKKMYCFNAMWGVEYFLTICIKIAEMTTDYDRCKIRREGKGFVWTKRLIEELRFRKCI